MYYRIPTRFFHVSSRIFFADKNALATLRKKTGYTFANCKKALEMHGNDVTKVRKYFLNLIKSLTGSYHFRLNNGLRNKHKLWDGQKQQN